MEKVTYKITRTDCITYENTFTNVKVRKDENGVSIYSKEYHGLLLAFYPINWALELVEIEHL